LVAFPYLLIFSLKISNVLILLLFVIAFADAFQKKRWDINIKNLAWCSSIFIVTIVAAFYSADQQQAWRDVESRLPLVLFPVAFSLKFPTPQDFKSLLRHLYISLGFTFFVLLVIALWRNAQAPLPEIWFIKWLYYYTDFTEPIDIHPLYLSLYVAFAILILCIDIVGIKKVLHLSTGKKVAILLILVIFFVMLSSRWIIAVMLCTCIVILFIARRQISRYWFMGFVAFVAIIAVLILLSPVTRDRFFVTFTNKYSFSQYNIDRLVIWSVASGYIKENPEEFIVGKGTGSSEQLMDKLYKEKNIEWDFEKKTNTHNQYLEFLMNSGLLGLTWLLFFLIRSLKEFLSKKCWVGITFILLMSMGMVAENYLNRQKGIAFFAFTYTLLYFKNQKRQSMVLRTDSQ
jgi:O-antigen ligase